MTGKKRSQPEKATPLVGDSTLISKQWREMLTDKNIASIHVKEVRSGGGKQSKKQKNEKGQAGSTRPPPNYVTWNVRGEQKKMFFPTPVVGAKRVRLAGCGEVYDDDYLKGNHSVILYDGVHAVEEKVRQLHKLDKTKELTKEARAQVNSALKECHDWFDTVNQKVIPKVALEMFKLGLGTEEHTINYLDKLAAQMELDDMRLHKQDPSHKVLETEEYLQRLETPEERYLANIRFAPKRVNKVMTYMDKEDADEKFEKQKHELRCRKKAWQAASYVPSEIPEAVKRACEAAQRDIEYCKKNGLPPEKCETASIQLTQDRAPKPMVFRPVAFLNAKTGKAIPTPWDGSQVTNGDLVSTTLSFKITYFEATGLYYLRPTFDDMTLHYRIKDKPDFYTESNDAKFKPPESIFQEDVQPLENPFPEKEEEQQPDEDLN